MEEVYRVVPDSLTPAGERRFAPAMIGRTTLSLLAGCCALGACTDPVSTTADVDAGIAPLLDAGGGTSGDAAVPPASLAQHIYVPSQSDRAIYVFEVGPGASDRPVRKIVGPSTKLENPQSVVVDATGALYVVNYERDVTVYKAGADGDAAPFFTFATGGHPQSISHPSSPTIIGWTKSNDRTDTTVFAYQDPYQTEPGLNVGSFAKPNIRGGWQWSPTGPYGCAANSVIRDGCVLVPMPTGLSVGCAATQCSGSASGTSSFELSGRAVGSPSNYLGFRPDGAIVASFTHPNTVATHTLASINAGYGTLTQIHAVVGPKTGLDQPNTVVFDTAGNMYVANTGLSSNAGTVTVYSPDADGDVAPIRTLGGIDHPFSVAIGP